MSMLWAKAKYWGALIVAGLFTALAIFGATMKGQRDRARIKAETLEATVNAVRVKKLIKKKEEVKSISRRADILKEIEEKKKLDKGEANDFKGIDTLGSNDW